MKVIAISVYDNGVAAFGRPVFVRSKGEALRGFQDEVNKPDREDRPNAMAAHPQDFQLFYLGEFDDETGKFTCPDMPDKMMDATSARIEK